MIDDNSKKLSLHIGEKNLITVNSGFVDVNSAQPTKLTLNKQTISSLNMRNDGGGDQTQVGLSWFRRDRCTRAQTCESCDCSTRPDSSIVFHTNLFLCDDCTH